MVKVTKKNRKRLLARFIKDYVDGCHDIDLALHWAEMGLKARYEKYTDDELTSEFAKNEWPPEEYE